MTGPFKEAMSRRIRECARIVGSGDELARRSGVPRRTLETYLSGRSEPKATGLALIAEAAGVSLDWLLLGRGEPIPCGSGSPASSPTHAMIDVALLAQVVATIEDWLAANNRTLAAPKKADVIVLAYELVRQGAANGEAESALQHVVRLLRVAL